VALREQQRRRLGGKPLATAGIADPQDRLDHHATMIDPKPPGRCAGRQLISPYNPRASADLTGRPP
jgi:hypothetical protein